MQTAFMRAAHSFSADTLRDPTSRQDPSTLCLSFAAGDVVYVHGLHSTGWADGTLCATAERGWIPADYLADIDDSRYAELHKKLALFLNDPQSQKLRGTTNQYTFSQTLINSIISDTKTSLENLNVWRKDGPLVTESEVVWRTRKTLTTELAHMVHVAKANKHTTSTEVISKLARAALRMAQKISDLASVVDHATYSESILSSSGSNVNHQVVPNKHHARSKSHDIKPHSAGNELQSYEKSRASLRPKSFIDHEVVPLPIDRIHEIANALDMYLKKFKELAREMDDVISHATSASVLQLTRHSMLACREMLIVLDLHPTMFEESKDLILENVRRLVGSARSVVAVLSAPASLRRVAMQNLVFIADECTDSTLNAARECLLFLRHTPGLRLPMDRTYPVFPHIGRDVLDSYVPPQAKPQRHHTQRSPLRPNSTSGRRSATSPVKLFRNEDYENDHDHEDDDQDGQDEELQEGFRSSLHDTRSSIESGSRDSVSAKSTIIARGTHSSSEHDISPSTSEPHLNHVVQSGTSTAPPPFPRSSTPEGNDTPLLVEPSTPPRLIQKEFRSPKRSPSVPSVRNTPARNRRTLSMPSSAIPVIMPPLPLNNLESELVFRNDVIRGGTPRALICWLTSNPELTFELRTFLLCFKLFTTTETVLNTLDAIKSDERYAGVRRFANDWVLGFWDPEDNSKLLELEDLVDVDIISIKRHFVSENSRGNIETLPLDPYAFEDSGLNMNLEPTTLTSNQSTREKEREREREKEKEDLAYILPPPPKPTKRGSRHGSMGSFAHSFRELSLSSRRSSKNITEESKIIAAETIYSEGVLLVLHTEPRKLAQQLTLMWYNVFKRVQASEFLDQRFSTSKRHLQLAPHLCSLVLLSNKLSAFVGDTMLSEELTPKLRTRMLTLWIEIAHELLKIGNLNGAITVALTLKSDRLTRLSKTWKTLLSKTEQLLEEVTPLMSHERNFSAYRKAVKERRGPCIPFFGVLIGDLVLIDEGNPREIALGDWSAVNFDRYLKAARIIANVQRFQAQEFEFENDLLFQTYLETAMDHSHNLEVQDKDEQWRRSKLIENRESYA